MASTFTILQEGKDEIVTVYLPITALQGAWDACGVYELVLSAKTESGNPPSIEWMDYINATVFNEYPLLNTYFKNKADYSYVLTINPNTTNDDGCKVDTTQNIPFPNGIITCEKPQPSGIFRCFSVDLTSTDTTKVVLEPSKSGFQYCSEG